MRYHPFLQTIHRSPWAENLPLCESAAFASQRSRVRIPYRPPIRKNPNHLWMVRIFLFFHRENLALICSHSAGSVQTALSKLERECFVSATVSLQGKRRKKLFSITPSGREAFAAWAAQPMQAEKVKNMELAHLFFLGLARPEARKAAIQDYIRQME